MRRLHDIIDSLDRVPYPLAHVVAQAKGLSLLDAPKVDGNHMTCEVCVCTDIVDYQQEVILASGVDVANHMKNPQVWYEHNEDSLYTGPLAQSEDEDGNYTLTKPDDFNIFAVSHFAKTAEHFPIIYQIFGLIDNGVLRATSIHVQPNPGGISTYTNRENGGKYKVTEDSHLIEYSHCKVGVNPEALKKALRFDSRLNPQISEEFKRAVELTVDAASRLYNSNKIGGHTLLPAVKKSLSAMVRTGSSMTLLTGDSKEASDMANEARKKSISSQELSKLSKGKLESIVGSDAELEKYTLASQAKLKSMFKTVMEDFEQEIEEGDEDEKESDKEVEDTDAKSTAHHSDSEEAEEVVEGEEVDGDDTESDDDAKEDEVVEEVKKNKTGEGMKLGQSVLTEAYDAMDYLANSIEKAMGPVENPDVSEGMTEILGQVRSMVESLDGLHAKAYGKSFTTKDEAEEAVADEEENLKSQLKSFLSQRGKQTESYRIIGHAARLREYGQRNDVPEAVRKSLINLSNGLEAIQTSAQQLQADSISREEFDAMVVERDEAFASQRKAMKQRDVLLDRLEKLTADALPAS